jgi:hypothetical protein
MGIPGAPHGGTSLYALDRTNCARTHYIGFDVHPGRKPGCEDCQSNRQQRVHIDTEVRVICGLGPGIAD